MKLRSMLATGLLLSLSINANATLTSVANGLGVYDSGLNATWTSDANLLGTMGSQKGITAIVNDILQANYDVSLNASVIHDTPNYYDNGTFYLSASDFQSNGAVDWWGAQSFVNYLNSIDYAGKTNWALPTTPDSDNSVGYNQTSSQLGELFYNELSGNAGVNIPSSNLCSFGVDSECWSGTEYASDPNRSWFFDTSNGNQGYYTKYVHFNVWAVSSDYSSTVPEPSIFYFFSRGAYLWCR